MRKTAAATAYPEKSTTVRNLVETGSVALLSRTLGTLAKIRPEAASRWAQKLYSTPPRVPSPPGERAVLETAHRFRFRSGKHELAAWSWGDGPTVFCLHGWGGRAGQFHAFVAPLVSAGFSVVAIDAPAHGTSPGRRAGLADFANALDAIVRWTGPAHAVVAHSMGGAAAVLAVERGLRVGRLVLIAPPPDAARYVDAFARRLALPEEVKRSLEDRLARPLGVPWESLSLVEAASRMTVPGLIVQDKSDAQVPHEPIQELARRWPGGELILTEGHGHFRILRSNEVIAGVVRFVRAAPPSGKVAPGERGLARLTLVQT